MQKKNDRSRKMNSLGRVRTVAWLFTDCREYGQYLL